MKRKALFIGVNEYTDPEIRNLNCSCRDAISMHDIFELLGYQTKLLEDPSKVDVFNAIMEMTIGNSREEALGPGDQFLMYFAGHGFTDSGQHLLFCADDMYKQLRYHRAGIPFDQLEEETRSGGYDRVFLLDACQSDFLTGTRGEDTTTRDLVAIGDMVPSFEDATGSFYVLRSCSKFEHALEIESRKHGLFTLGMLELLRQSKKDNVELAFNDSLREAVRKKMWCIAESAGITVRQTPESNGRGAAQVLLSGINTSIQLSTSALPPSAVAGYVICPICGKKNHPENTFKCRVCNRDNLCLRHQDEKTFLCFNCADAKRKSVKSTLQSQSMSVKDAYERGENYYYGRNGFGQDYAEAVKWYRKAAEQGDASGQYILGVMCENGCGVTQDDYEAVKWYRKAAEQGIAAAQFNLGFMYANGRGVTKDDSEAVKWYRKAAEQGDAAAQNNLGVMYANGCGVTQDESEAVKWCRKAAEQGIAQAQFNLGNMYANGCGVTQDDSEAVKWYRKAAEQGHASAQFVLGWMYESGRGVPKDDSEAVKWYRKAAEQGQADAQATLKRFR